MSNSKQIPLFKFNSQTQKWEPLYKYSSKSPTNKTSLKLATWNILFYLDEPSEKISLEAYREEQEKHKNAALLLLADPQNQSYIDALRATVCASLIKHSVLQAKEAILLQILKQIKDKQIIFSAFQKLFLHQIVNASYQNEPVHCEAVSQVFNDCIKENIVNFHDAVSKVFTAGKLSYFSQLALDNGKRYKHVLRDLLAVQADVIALQEVKLKFIQLLMNEKWVQDQYMLSEIALSDTELATYGPLNNEHVFIPIIMTRVPFDSCHNIPLPSTRRRPKLSFATRLQISVKNQAEEEEGNENNKKSSNDNNNEKKKTSSSSLSVYSVHLESHDEYIQERKKQLETLIGMQCEEGQENYIIMGDMNAHNEEDQKVIDSLPVLDMWHCFEREENEHGFTFDGKVNSVIKQVYMYCEKRQMRLDRILSGMNNKWKAKSKMQIIGNQGKEHGSDHFGLTIEIEEAIGSNCKKKNIVV